MVSFVAWIEPWSLLLQHPQASSAGMLDGDVPLFSFGVKLSSWLWDIVLAVFPLLSTLGSGVFSPIMVFDRGVCVGPLGLVSTIGGVDHTLFYFRWIL